MASIQRLVLISQILSAVVGLSVFGGLADAREVPANCRKEYNSWRSSDFPYGGFAVGRKGGCGWSFQNQSQAEADQVAIKSCASLDKSCIIVDRLVTTTQNSRDWFVCSNTALPPRTILDACSRLLASTKGGKRAYVYVQRAYAQASLGQDRASLDDLNAALAASPKNAPGYWARANFLKNDYHYLEAIADFMQFLKNWKGEKKFVTEAKDKISQMEGQLATIAKTSDKETCDRALESSLEVFSNLDAHKNFNRLYVLEAQKRKMDMKACRIAVGLSAEPSVGGNLSIVDLCRAALSDDLMTWKTDLAATYLPEFNRRKLVFTDCWQAVTQRRNLTVHWQKSDNEICQPIMNVEMSGFRQGIGSDDIPFYNEALARKLDKGDCRVALGLERTFNPQANLALSDLCFKALNTNLDNLEFFNPFTRPFVEEIQRRGLNSGDCRVAFGKSREIYDTAQFALAQDVSDFAKQIKDQRRGLELARAVVAINAKFVNPRDETLKPALAALQKIIADYPGFAAFLEARKAQVKNSKLAKARGRKAVLAMAKEFAAKQAIADMLAPGAQELLSFVDDVETMFKSANNAHVLGKIAAFSALLKAQNLDEPYATFVESKCGKRLIGECEAALALLESFAGPAKVAMTSGDEEEVEAEATLVPAITTTPAVIATDGKRVALVIGNSKYQNAQELANPTNDSVAISAALTELGFKVIEGENLSKQDMDLKIREFARDVATAEVGLFFYAGHGMQINGKNYLIPVDAMLADETAIEFETVNVDQILGYMASEMRVSIALLDACRNNPLARRFKRKLMASREVKDNEGLAAPTQRIGGTLIGFATSPDETAQDGIGKNSPFTTALLKHIGTKGLEIEQMFKRVKSDVNSVTNQEQTPWTNSALLTEFYLNP